MPTPELLSKLSFLKYVPQLREIVRHECKTCSKEHCLAGGESYNTSKGRAKDDLDDLDLFHCSNLQGVILEVGMFMLENLYLDQTSNTSSEDGGNKRKSSEPVHSSSTPDDDDDSHGLIPVQKKKQKSVLDMQVMFAKT